MTYDAEMERVTYRSDRADGPTAGTATVDPLEFLARLVTHIPDPGQVMPPRRGCPRAPGTPEWTPREPARTLGGEGNP